MPAHRHRRAVLIAAVALSALIAAAEYAHAGTAAASATTAPTAASAPTASTTPTSASAPTAASAATATTGTSAPTDVGAIDEFADFGELDLAGLLDATVESASGAAEQISLAPAIIEVVTPQQLRAWGASNLYDALAHIANTQMMENHWGRTVVSIRGLHPGLFNNRVLLLIDGHPLFEVGNQSFFLEQIPLSVIERVELIRGPGGVLFGTNAFAGVIHVFTKTPSAAGAEAAVGAGALLPKVSRRYDQALNLDVRASGGAVWQDGYAQADVQFQRTPRWTARVDAAQAANATTATLAREFPLQSTNVALIGKIGQTLNGHRLRLLGGVHQLEKFKWGLIPVADSPSLPSTFFDAFAVGYWDYALGGLSLHARVGYDVHTQDNDLGVNGFQAPFPAPYNTDPMEVPVEVAKIEGAFALDGATWQERLELSGGIQGSAYDLETYTMRMQSDGAIAPTIPLLDSGLATIDVNLFAQATLRPVSRLSLMIGGRVNYFDPTQVRPDLPDPDPTVTVNPRAAVIYAFHDRVSGKLLYGRAFRVPAVFELFVTAATVIGGDPGLRPETVDTYEAAIDARPRDDWSVRVNGFATLVSDNIAFANMPDGTEVYVNAAGITVFGVEITSRWLYEPWLDTFVSAGFQEGRERGTGQRYLTEITRLSGSLGTVFHALDRRLHVAPTARYIGPRDHLGGATLWDATVYFDVHDNVTIGVAALNVFDRSYADIEVIRRDTPSGVVQNQPRLVTGWIVGHF